MKQKIEWYQEILDVEPGSKVFFTLARLQAEGDQLEVAADTLRRGLGYNPEHIEARLLLADILFRQGKPEATYKEVELVTVMLERYPGFWSAWTERLSRKPQSRDAALALSFFAAVLKGESISWASVIESGLTQLLSGKSVALPPARGSARRTQAKSGSQNKGKDVETVKKSRSTSSVKSLPPKPLEEEELEIEEEETGEEQFSLKTRSMAEVLAEQGDYAGALTIYEDLLRETPDEKEKASLESAIARLSAEAGAIPPVSSPAAQEEDHLAGQPVLTRVLDVLEKLVGRVEERAGGIVSPAK